jgi:hypothetical protein
MKRDCHILLENKMYPQLINLSNYVYNLYDSQPI